MLCTTITMTIQNQKKENLLQVACIKFVHACVHNSISAVNWKTGKLFLSNKTSTLPYGRRYPSGFDRFLLLPLLLACACVIYTLLIFVRTWFRLLPLILFGHFPPPPPQKYFFHTCIHKPTQTRTQIERERRAEIALLYFHYMLCYGPCALHTIPLIWRKRRRGASGEHIVEKSLRQFNSFLKSPLFDCFQIEKKMRRVSE